MKFYLVCILCFLSSLQYAYGNLIEIGNWKNSGPISNGEWNLRPDKHSVLQSAHSNPTYFIGGEALVNQTFNGYLSVEDNSDDDFIGLVFGFNGFDDYYLLDWKRSTQVYRGKTAEEGFRLSRVNNRNQVDLWDHSGQGIDILATAFGSDMGWDDNVNYEVTLGYTNTEINLMVNGGTFNNKQVFSLSGLKNKEGQIGFYTFSQGAVSFSDFRESNCQVNCGIVEVSEPGMVGVLLISLVILFVNFPRRKR